MKITYDKSAHLLLGDMLKELRNELGFSQTTVAEYLGIDRTTYTKYELGRMPDVSTVIKIASLYNISAESIISTFFLNEDNSNSRYAVLGSSDKESAICLLSKEEQLLIEYYRKSMRKSDILDSFQNAFIREKLNIDDESDND